METYLYEFIEAFTHLMLYIMSIYSSEYFEKKRKFNTLVWHCVNNQIEVYIQQALNPIKKFILDKSLYKYRLIFKNLKDQVLKIYTIEFEQFYKTHSTEISYSSIENFVWDFFTYAEMCLTEQNNIEKTFEIAFDLMKDYEDNPEIKESLKDEWELITHENQNIYKKQILKSMHVSDNNNPRVVCQIYVESCLE
ncbi:HORMA domain protein, putative [Plasmodium vinckei brucechwatti]|uniref:HORMA domain protein, putative n=1 Tax=Plasmodium vinckei brucechwatti TaxID=119398 RepID=A0A6V7RWW0_PLAVN|nr:HORMA domain protein, putative [Plasmodium vinckei brucechwatti]